MNSKKSVKCKLCDKRYVSKKALIDHIEKSHSSSIPEGWNAARYENYLRTGKTEGRCVYCKKETTWNDATGKYNRMCGSEECKKTARELASKNYIGLHGKAYSINDPEQQKKMVYSRKNSGTYIFEDEDTGKKYKAMYDSSYGKDFFEMLDTFLNWDGSDIIAPSPHTYWYEYEGKKHFYIPDAYSTSLNLEIELKDGGDNPNKHPKIQAVDKVKEKKKDEVMNSLKGQVNYIKICNKDYSGFFALLSELKEKDNCQLPKWENKLESITEGELLINELPNEPITESRDSRDAERYKFLQRAKDIYDPMLNYNDLLEYYRKRLFVDRLNKREWSNLYNELLNTREYLQKVTNEQSGDYNERMAYEARKALEDINKFIDYMEQKDTKRIPVEESFNMSSKVPIYIVCWRYNSLIGAGVKLAIGSKYNHASIALTPDLEDCYTFARTVHSNKSINTNGFCRESISYMEKVHPGCEIKVHAVYVSQSSYDKLKDLIEDYISKQKDTHFDYFNMLCILLGIKRENIDEDNLNCSVFVDLVLKQSGVDITDGKPSNLVTPKDFEYCDKGKKNIVTIYVGKAKDYDKNKISKISMESTFVEGIKDNEVFYPVYIFLCYTGTAVATVIKKFTRDPYAHATLSFDNTLTNMVSFDARGMVIENIHAEIYNKRKDKITYSLYMYMASANEYLSMKNFVDGLLEKKDRLKYNTIGLTNFIFGRGSEREDRFFCSEFVASAIAAGNDAVLKSKTFMTTPCMLAKNRNFTFIKKGILKNYNPKDADKIIKEKLKERGFEDVRFKD